MEQRYKIYDMHIAYEHLIIVGSKQNSLTAKAMNIHSMYVLSSKL